MAISRESTGHYRRSVPCGDDFRPVPSGDGGVKGCLEKPSGPVDGLGSADELPRRRSSRLGRDPILRAHLLRSELFFEAQAQSIVDWSLSKKYSLTPHLAAPSIFSLSLDEEPSSHTDVERHPRRQEWGW